MVESLDIMGKDLSGSKLAQSSLSRASFDDLSLSGATFNNINLRAGARSKPGSAHVKTAGHRVQAQS